VSTFIGQNLAVQFEAGYAVFVHTDRPPTASDWSRVVAEYRKVPNVKTIRVLVYSEGGAPSAAQRAELLSAMGLAQPRLAILTKSIIARVAAKAVALFAPELRVFDANQLEAALDYLQLSGSERMNARSTLDSLRSAVLGRRSSRSPDRPAR
jgi:hypothetical protein